MQKGTISLIVELEEVRNLIEAVTAYIFVDTDVPSSTMNMGFSFLINEHLRWCFGIDKEEESPLEGALYTSSELLTELSDKIIAIDLDQRFSYLSLKTCDLVDCISFNKYGAVIFTYNNRSGECLTISVF